MSNRHRLLINVLMMTFLVSLPTVIMSGFGSPIYSQKKKSASSATKSDPLINLRQGTKFEVAPHTGIMNGSGIFGLKLAMNYSALSLELSGEQVIGKTANLYPLQFNIAYNLAKTGQLLPFASVGGGLFMTVPTNALGSKTVSTMGFNFGAGARYYMTRSFGFRMELRQHMTRVNNELTAQNEFLRFTEVAVGITFMFH